MEFLDSLDLDTTHKKSHRVRSWYLYEQFKSLERSQLDAAQKLKDRSYQERILRQELSERRARRKLYDQFGLCQSEPRLKRDKSDSNYRTSISTSEDDFFESFYLLHEDERLTQGTGRNEFTGEGEGEGDTFSQDSASQCCITNYVGVDDHKYHNGSSVGSVTSVVENLKQPNDELLPPKEMEFKQKSIDEDLKNSTDGDVKNSTDEDIKNSTDEDIKNSTDEDIKNSTDEDIKNSTDDDIKNSIDEDIKTTIAEDINTQLDSVKENILCLEKITKDEDVDRISEVDSFDKTAVRQLKHVAVTKKADQECNVVAIWSRLVSFAYQVVQLNHGHILQPYVSPIEFASDESDASNASSSLNVKRKKSVQLRKYRKIYETKPWSRKNAKKLNKTRGSSQRKCSGGHYSENHIHTQSFANGMDAKARPRRASEPRRSSAKLYHQTHEINLRSSSSSTVWSDFLKEKPKVSRRYCYRYHNKALHPMLKIAKCIDSILKDIEDTTHDV